MKKGFKPHLWFVNLVSRIVPRRFRSDWKQEWEAELVHRESLLQEWRRSDWIARWNLMQRSLASFWDALAMQPRRLEEEVVQDLRYGIRILLQNKGITGVAILSLALGIGANTALFSLIDAMLLRTLAVPNPEELVLFNWSASEEAAGPSGITFDGNRRDPVTGVTTWDSFSYRTFEQFKERNETLSTVFAFARIYRINIVADGNAEIGNGQLVSGGYFSGLRVNPILGRNIQESDDHPSAPPVAVMGYDYWQQRFGRDPAIIGKIVTVNGSPLTVIGIAASEFSGTLQVNDSPDIYIPMGLEATLLTYNNGRVLEEQDRWWLQIMGRLKSATSLDQVQANMEGVFRQTTLEMLGDNSANRELPRLEVVSGSQGLDSTRAGYFEPLMILMIIMGLVLLIACANVANLLLARGAERHKEIATRMSMGATRLRLVRQLLTESVLLAVLGGVLGALFAYWGKDFLLKWGPWSGQAEQVAVRMDLRVLAFAAAVSLITGILFGLAPAIRAMRSDLASAMMQNSRTFSAGRSKLGTTLLVAQVAMSIVLLVGAGLFVQTLRNLKDGNVGFDPQNLLLFKVDPALNRYQPAQVATTIEGLIERIQGLDGVQAVSLSSNALVGGGGNFGSSTGSDGLTVSAAYLSARSNFFETVGVPVVAGRTFGRRQDETSGTEVVINETLARQYFPDTNPIGKSVWNMEVIGVVRDTKYSNLRREIPAVIFTPYRGNPQQMTFVIRTSSDAGRLIPLIREAVKQVDPNLPIYDVRTQEELIDQTLRQERLFANFATAFGALALFLVCVGLYGVMSYNVLRRTHEIGIRMALGAQRSGVRALVMRETLLLVLMGVVVGIGGAMALTRQIEARLFGLTPNDPVIIAIAIGLMVVIAAFAGYLPARRASEVDPMVALRYE